MWKSKELRYTLEEKTFKLVISEWWIDIIFNTDLYFLKVVKVNKTLGLQRCEENVRHT